MTDRELIEQWLRPGAIIPVNNNAIRVLLEALRDRLAQPEYEFECPRCGHCCQQREWVGLTDEEVWECYSDRGSVFYRDIEAKLKEKNSG